jgi:hypothetical protein
VEGFFGIGPPALGPRVRRQNRRCPHAANGDAPTPQTAMPPRRKRRCPHAVNNDALRRERRRKQAGEKCQTVCKPGSVRPLWRRDDHSSGTRLATRLTRPTRVAGRECPCNYHGFRNRDVAATPIRSCSRWGLPCRLCCQRRGALLPHRFALARGTCLLTQADLARAVCFLWHCPWGRPRRPLAGTVFPWSPDFPPHAELLCAQRPSNCLAPGDVLRHAQAVKRPDGTSAPRGQCCAPRGAMLGCA